VTLPDYKSMMLPLLKFASDCNEHSPKEAGETLSKIFDLTDEVRAIPHPSGRSLFNNRVN
jgi:restriction system protein